MLSFLPSLIIYPIHLILQIASMSLWATILTLFGIIKFLLPFKVLIRIINPIMSVAFFAFGRCSVALIKLFNNTDWQYIVNGELSKDNWYLMMPNHLSYLDIILLVDFSADHIPSPKFFVKKELIWMPCVGVAAWALDMPFMQRYSRQFIEKNPHLKGKDIDATRKSCKKFKHTPTTVINFVEGSRCTPEKQKLKASPYKHLLPPKAGGIAFTLAAMGEQFTNILDVTIQYPNNQLHPMNDMLGGKLKKVVIHIDVIPVSEDVVGDYFNDEAYKSRFQTWLNQTWHRKDELITKIKTGEF
jgi:1-acyl-sn-glycerol-3-phosphate acyltransferase